MNEELLKKLYDKYNLSNVGTFDEFKNDMSLPEVRKKFFDNHGLQSTGNFNEFEKDLGANIKTPLHDYFGHLESDGNYQAYNPDGGGQGAVGAYQVRYQSHQKEIQDITGVKTRDEFYSDPYAQDKYMSHLLEQYQQHLPELQKINEERGLGLTDEELMYTEHHEGFDGAKKYLATGQSKFGSETALDSMYKKGRKFLEQGPLVQSHGSASDPVSSLLSFDGDVDSSRFNDELIKNLYKNNGGEGEIKSAHIKKHYGIFGKYNDTYDIEVNDNMGKSTHMKFEDIANSSSLESSQNNLIQSAGAFFNGVLGAVSGAGGLLKDVQELVTSGDTSFDKMFDYQDNPLTKYLTDSYNVNVDNNNYSDGYKKLLEQEQIAKEGGDNISALGNALTKIFYPEYWKENGLETVANSLSFMVPGFGLAKVAGAAVKGAKVLGMGEKATKLVTELGIYSGLNSALEAGAEGAETFKAAYEHGLKTGMSEEEARVMAADYATEVAAVNMPILMASNALEFMGISGKLMSAPGLKRFAYNTIGTALPEGIQEGLQFGIQDNAKRYETEKYDPGKVGLIDSFSESMGGSLDAAYKGMLGANPEFYDSVVMGAVMGGGFAVPGAAKSTYDYYKVEKPIASEVNSVLANSFSDIFQRDENGNFINENGKIKINGTKLQSHLNGLQHERYLNELEDLATAQDNGEAIKLVQGNKISKIIHDSISSGKDVDAIKNAIDQAFTPEAYKTNGLKNHYNFEEYKDFRNNAVKFAEDSYNETYSNPLLSKQSTSFKENVYYNLSQQKIANHELDKYEGRLNSLPETLSPLQKLEKKDLETKIDALGKFAQNLEEASSKIFKEANEDKKQAKTDKVNNTPIEETLAGFEEQIPKGKAAEDVLKEEKKRIVLESLDSFTSKAEYQEAINQFPDFSKEISDNYNSRIEKQKSVQPEITSAKNLVNRYGEENNLLKESETEEIFSNFKSRLKSKPNLAKEIKQYEILRNNPEHTFKPDPELKFLGQHILAGGTLDSYTSLEGLEHNIADPLLQESIDSRSIKKVNPKQKNLEELTTKINDEHQAGTLTKDDAYRYTEEAYNNKQITKTAKDKLNKSIDKLFNLPPDPRLKKLMDFGYTEVQAQEFINDGRADTVIANKGKLDVEFEQGPSIITPMFMDTAKGLRSDNQYLRQVEVTEPDGKKSLHDITRDELFGDNNTSGLWSSSKRDLLAKRFNVSEESTFRIVSQPSSIYETNLVETNRILSTAKPGDQFYYETDYKRGNNLEDFEINVVFYSKNGKIVDNKTEGAKRHVAGMVRSLNNSAIDNKFLQDGLRVDERKEVTTLRKNLFTGASTSYPIKLKAVSRKESLNIGNLRPLTAEELRNSFDTVISNWEGTELRFSSNENVLDPVSISGAGRIKEFLPRMAGKIFMFLKSWDINGNQKNIPVELETKKIKEVPRLMESLLEQLKSIEAQTTKEAAKEKQKDVWKKTKNIVQFRTVDSKYDRVNTSEGPKKGMENPRGGIGPVFLFNFETNSRSDRGFYTKIDGKTIKGLTAEQLLEKMQEYRVNVPHTPDKIKEFFLENSDVLLTDLDINSTQDNKLIFDNSSIKEIPKTEEKEEIVPKRRGEKVRFKITETKQDPNKDLSFITQRFKDLGIVVSNKELKKLAEIFGANTGTVWGAFHDAVLYLNEASGLKVQRHEAFHILFNVYLNDKQKEEILKEAFDKFGKELGISKEEFETWLSTNNQDIAKFKLEDSNQIDYTLKTIDTIQNNIDKVTKWYGTKNIDFWKKLNEDLQIPKDQVELLKKSSGNTIEEKLISFTTNYNYVIESNIITSTSENNYNTYIFNDEKYNEIGNMFLYEDKSKGRLPVDNELAKLIREYGTNLGQLTKTVPVQYYGNMTVPGGTKYTENEISTPLITPSIKGHAQFSTDNGIGWFRSDDKRQDKLTNNGNWIKTISEVPNEFYYNKGKIRVWKDNDGNWNEGKNYIDDDQNVIHKYNQSLGNTISDTSNTKTRRILEVQSDLFQKGRDKEDLVKGSEQETESTQEFFTIDNVDYQYSSFDGYEKWDYKSGKENWIPISYEEFNTAYLKLKNTDSQRKENKFLQLLNKDSNWVTFFVKSIIQDSAKKGYEKVLFPTGNTASKVEGHTTLEEFKRQKEDRIKELEETKIKNTLRPVPLEINFNEPQQNLSVDEEINQLKQELERVEKEGFAALKPIFKFYENAVANILKKNYGVKQITDKYGNTWNEVDIVPERDLSTIRLKSEDSFYQKQSPLIRLEEKLAEMYEDFSVENLGIVSESFKKAYPVISKIFDEIYKFIYDKYQKLKPYFTNKLSIQDIFYQLEKNTFDKEVFAKRLNSYKKLSSETARFKIDTLTPVEVKKYARFIATDVLEQMLWNFESKGEDIKYLYLTSMTKSKRNEFINKFLSYGEIDKYVRAHFKELGNPNTGLKIEEALKANRSEFLKYIMQDVNALYDTKYYLEEVEEEEKVLLIRETNVNPTENIKGKLKEYLTRIPIRRLINNKYEKEIDEEFGIPKRYDFEQLYNKLLHSLSDNPNIDRFWDKIEELSSQFDWMDTVYTSIKDNMEVNELDQYYQSELFRLLYAKTGGMRNIDFITESRSKNNVNFYHNGKNAVANKLNDVIADKYETQQINLPELRQIVKTKKLTKNNVHPFLTEFGYELDQSDALFLFKNSKTNLDYLFNLLSNLEIKDNFNPFQDYRTSSATRGVSKKVAELPSQYTLTVLTVNNENEYVHQANNFLTKFFTKTEEEFRDLATKMESKLIHKGIHLYKGLAAGKLATISYDLGIKNKGKAKEYKNYLFVDLLSHDLNAYLTEFKSSKGGQIRIPLPTFSDATNRAYLTTTLAKDILTSIVPLVKAEIERIKYCQENVTGMKNFDINGKEFILFPFLEAHRKTLFDTSPELLDKKIKELVNNHVEEGYQQYLKTLVEEGLILKEEKKSDNGETYIEYKFTDELHKLDAHESVEYTIKEYYNQRWYYNTQLIPMLAGDLAFYGNYKSPTSKFSYEKVADDLLKRMKELHSPKEDAIIIDDNNNLKTIRQLVVPDIIVESLEKELEDYRAINPNTKISNNNITDGQIITTLDFNRQVRDAYGELTEDDKIEYQKIKEGKQGRVTPGFTKPYYYNLEDKDNLLYPLQEKSSEFPLIPAEAFLTKNGEVEFPGEVTDFNKYARPTLAKILWLMNGAGDKTRAFDKVVFQSAIKTDIDLTKLLSIEEIQSLNYDKIYSSIQSHAATEYGRQQIVPTDKHFNNTLKIGSQSRVLITADIQEDIVVTIDGKKRVLTPVEAREVFNSILVANIEENKKEVAAKFADTKSLNDSFKEQAINRNKSVEELKAYEMQADGKSAVPFDYPLTTKENQKLSNAVSKKALISATPGGTFVNRTSIDYADDLEIKRIYDENGKAIGVKYVEVAIPAHNSALSLLADKNGVIDFEKLRESYANFDKLLDGFGYRIPTEDKYSMYPIKIKRILPKNVDAAIVLPKEATEITGLDFDVDKMFVLFRAFNIKRGDFSIFTDTVNLYAKQVNLLNVDGTNVVYSKEQAKDIFNAMLVNAPANTEAERIIMDYIKDDFEDLKLMIKIEELGYIEPSMDNTLSRHNLMMDIILEITKTPSFAKSFFEGGSSQILKDNIDRLDKFGKLDKDVPKGILEPLHQDYNSKKAIVGGNIISIAASHSKHHSTVEGLQGKFGTSYPINMFDNKLYQDLTKREGEGGRISKLLSAILFASTEHIKNPLLDALNITTENVSIFLTGLRLGIPFDHMATLFRYPAVIDLFKSLANTNFPTENDFRKHLADKYKINDKKQFDYFKSLAERTVSHSTVENGILKNDPELDKILLSKVLRLFDVSNELDSIMVAGKMDTEKNFGPTIYDNLFSVKRIDDLYKTDPVNRKIDGLENVLPNIKIVDGNFEMGSSLLKLNDAYISLLVDQLNSLRKHFGFLSEAFQQVSNVVIDKTGLKVSNFGPKKLETIHNAIKVATAQSFLKFDYNRVLKINKQFSELKKDKNFKDLCPNLLGTIKVVKLGDQKVIKKITPYKIDKGTTALIKNEWETLMGDPRYSEFAKELAIYALITSDFSFGIDSFSQFVPAYSFLTGTEQGMKIREFFNNMGNMQRFIDIGLDLLSERIILNEPELTKYVDTTNDVDIVSSFKVKYGALFPQVVKIPEIIKLKGNKQQVYLNTYGDPLKYIHTTVYYNYRPTPILYERQDNGNYKMVELLSNPAAYSVYTNEAQSFYPLKRPDVPVKETSEEDQRAMAEKGFFNEVETEDGFFIPDENSAVDISTLNLAPNVITNFEAKYATPGAKKAGFDKKDVEKFNNKITKLISRGSSISSSEGYKKEFIEKGLPVNSGNYISTDVVGISAEGNRLGRIGPDFKEIDKAISSNVSFITDSKLTEYNIGEKEVHEHLTKAGYFNYNGLWKKTSVKYTDINSIEKKIREELFNNKTIVEEEEVVDENGFFVPKSSLQKLKREFKVDHYTISLQSDGKMYFSNNAEVLDQTIQNKVLVQKESQDKTAKTLSYNNTDYVVLSDNRIISLANYQEKTFTEKQRDFIIKSAKKMC